MRKGKKGITLASNGNCLSYAVALQDHHSRTYQLPGSQKLPSCAPGAVPTLAQRIGLFPAPDKLLTPDQWDAVHGLARQRQEHMHQCSICLEPFKNEQQVLLSCSHVFHTQCLASFEQYARVRACPLCRKQWYQKLIINDAAEAYRHECATRIQAAVRSWLCRKHLHLSELRHSPPQALRLKRQWAAGRLCEAGQALIALQEQDSLEELFRELDADRTAAEQVHSQPPTLAQDSRHALLESACQYSGHESRFEGYLHDRVSKNRGGRGRGDNATPSGRSTIEQRHTTQEALSTASRGSGAAGGSGIQPGQGRPSSTAAIHARYKADTIPAVDVDADWSCVVSKACQRAETECAICLSPLSRREQEGIALLSCSHVFHMQCVLSFEAFECGRGGKPSCPVCRAAYTRRCFAVPCTVAPSS